jgi:dephospho-CoA kinase
MTQSSVAQRVFGHQHRAMEEKFIVGVGGEKAGGKETLMKILLREYAHLITVVSSSNLLLQMLTDRQWSTDRDDYRKLFESEAARHGEDWLTKYMDVAVREARTPVVFWDSIRMPADFAKVQSYPHQLTVYVTASAKNRHERAMARNQKGEGNITLEQFLAQEAASNERFVPILGPQMAERIDNDGTREEFEVAVRNFWKEVRIPS